MNFSIYRLLLILLISTTAESLLNSMEQQTASQVPFTQDIPYNLKLTARLEIPVIGDYISNVLLSHDETVLLIQSENLQAESFDRINQLWDVLTKKEIGKFSEINALSKSCATLCLHKELFIMGGETPSLLFYENKPTETGSTQSFLHQSLAAPTTDTSFSAIAISPYGSWALGGSLEGLCTLWDLSKNSKSTPLQGHTDAVRTLAFNHNATIALTGSDDTTAIFWHIPTRTVLTIIKLHKKPLCSVVFSLDGTLSATASLDGKVYLWKSNIPDFDRHNKQAKVPYIKLQRNPGPISTLLFSSNGEMVLTGAIILDSTNLKVCSVVMLWHTRTGALIAKYLIKGEKILSAKLCFPRSFIIITEKCSADQTIIKLWKLLV